MRDYIGIEGAERASGLPPVNSSYNSSSVWDPDTSTNHTIFNVGVPELPTVTTDVPTMSLQC